MDFNQSVYDDPHELGRWMSRHQHETAVAELEGTLQSWKWPDCLGRWASHGGMVFSQRVIDAFKAARFRGYHLMPVKLTGRTMWRFWLPRPPKYFWLIPLGSPMRFERHYYEMIKTYDRKRPIRLEYRFTSDEDDALAGFGHYCSILEPLEEGWDGSDFLQCHPHVLLGAEGTFNCSRRVAELINTNEWTGFGAGAACQMGVVHPPLGEKRQHRWPPEPECFTRKPGWEEPYYPLPPGATSIEDARKHLVYANWRDVKAEIERTAHDEDKSS